MEKLKLLPNLLYVDDIFFIFLVGLSVLAISFDYVAHFLCLKDVWIRTQSDAVASVRVTKRSFHVSATHPST